MRIGEIVIVSKRGNEPETGNLPSALGPAWDEPVRSALAKIGPVAE